MFIAALISFWIGLAVGVGLTRCWSVYQGIRARRATERAIGPPLTLAEMRTLKDELHHQDKYGHWESP